MWRRSSGWRVIFSKDPHLLNRFQGLYAESKAIQFAIEWSADPRQTLASIEAALKAYQALPEMPDAGETIQTEWLLVENLLDSTPRPELRRWIETEFFGPNHSNGFHPWSVGLVKFVTTPWELERARRVFAELFAAKFVESGMEPSSRSRNSMYGGWEGVAFPGLERVTYRTGYDLRYDFESTPLARFLVPAFDSLLQNRDRMLVGRRALLQILALRVWQLKHDGNLPETLEELVPSVLSKLPKDPFSTGPFVYTRVADQFVFPFGPTGTVQNAIETSGKARGQRLLESVGADRRPDSETGNSRFNPGIRNVDDDIMFILPAAKNDPKIVPQPEEGQGQELAPVPPLPEVKP